MTWVGGGGRGNSMNFPWNRERSVTLKIYQGVKKRTVSDCQTEVLPAGSVKTKLLSEIMWLMQ